MTNKIVVHEKALAHLSRGLYRSPASALRELVSNAWDANATKVMISTNYPKFMQISVQDNGDGFGQEDFESLMKGGIGNSEKRQDEKKLINDRPLIGRLGIGMLAIAQICGEFTVSSKPKNGPAFRARVRLYDLIKEKLDRQDGDVFHADSYGVKEVDVGEYEILSPEHAPSRGTRITSGDVHPTFVRSFRESMHADEPPLDWRKALKKINSVASLRELGDYWKLIWELSASSPIPYIDATSVPQNAVRDIQKRLLDYNFSVTIDGIELKKPVYLKGNKAGYTVAVIKPETQKVYGRDLAFEGYIAVQEGKQLKPSELRGVMVRIKNVGVGYYDSSLLDYSVNQGPRGTWVTGEIYVSSGLEDALNVDRDSFNRFHPDFRAIQTRVHGVLQEDVFPKVYKEIEERTEQKAATRRVSRLAAVRDVLAEVTDRSVHVSKESKTADDVSLSVRGDAPRRTADRRVCDSRRGPPGAA